MNPRWCTLATLGIVLGLTQVYALPPLDARDITLPSDCPGDKLMKSISCKNEMESLRNKYRNMLSNLQELLADTIDKANGIAEAQINPLCSKLSLTTPLIRPEDVELCVLSEWSEWSKPIGFGKIERTREILKQGCGCPEDEGELKQTVDISKYSGNSNATSVADEFQGGFLTNGTNPSLPRDILIVLDSSGSIHDEDFEFMKEGLITMIDLFCGGFGEDQANNRLAIIQFASNVTIIHNFGDSQNANTLKQKVRELRHYAGNTCTGNAMQVAYDDIFVAANGMRDFTVKDTLLVTDGQSNCGLDLRYTVNTKLQKKSQVWALGVGLSSSPIAKNELESVVTNQDNKHIFSLARFADFKEMIGTIKSRSTTDPCQPIET